MNGHDNLIPGNKRSKEEVREIGKKGGRASVAARRREKALKEVLNETLGIRIGDIQDEKVRSVLLTAAIIGPQVSKKSRITADNGNGGFSWPQLPCAPVVG